MIVGIDLGTTNSSISAYISGEVKLIPNSFGEVLTPSVVSFDSDGTYYVGAVAKERLVTNPETTFKEFKRQMGSECSFKAYRKSYKPEELSALVLKQLKEDAEKYTGETISDAVISVPAYFTNKQRAATRNAGLFAGLNVICLINEPSAAALTYHEKNIERDEKYLVFDFGGGTLDVTLVDAFDNIIEIQSISGDNYLGGSDFNRVIAIDICDKNNIKWADLSKEEIAILVNHGEEIKIALTDAESCTHKVVLKNKEYEYTLDRQGLLDISGEIFSKITIVLKRIMNDAGIDIEDIDGVIMIGGSSKMPVVQLFLNTLFNGQARYESNGDTIVCEGAGVVAGIKERKDEVKDLILTDIAPFSLGTETLGNVYSVIIPKNQVLPCSKMNFYTTTYDNQKQIDFKVYQGENIMASNNQLLGEYKVKIEQRPKGEVHVAVRYSYDLNGIFDIDISGDGVLKEVHASLGDVSGQSREDIIRRREEMNKLKVNPLSQEENVLLIEKAGRLAAECNSEQREFLQAALLAFINGCENGSMIASTEAKRQLEIVMQKIEETMFSFSDFDADLWHKYIEGCDSDNEKED